MKEIPFIQTSVFVDDRYSFSGNQLATFLDVEQFDLSTEELQGITQEMNYSESTFLFPSEVEQCAKKVRIFTPGKELKFAGHPTLGTAFVLKHLNIVPKEQQNTMLELGIGPIEVEFISDDEIAMKQPKPEFLSEFTDTKTLAKILSLDASSFSEQTTPQAVSTGFPFLIVQVDSLETIQKIELQPQVQLRALADFVTQEILVFTTETVHNDSSVHARMFAPSAGVLEDPATGSAAGPLGAFLAKYLFSGDSETAFVIEQGYEMNRPSQLVSQPLGPKEAFSNVVVSGKVRLTAKGHFIL